jgi:ribonuclease G
MGSREEVEDRALPFRQGDEVLVEIVEPHMYDVEDAVAKIDGYIISIAGAAPCVGEKRMVRIDKVGRTAASALLLDGSGEVVRPSAKAPTKSGSRGRRRAAPPAEDAGAVAEGSKARSRGRRRPAESEDAEARREAGLSESPTTLDSEPEEELATNADVAEQAPAGADQEDGLQSKPRRRGRRGGRRRSAAKAKATPE